MSHRLLLPALLFTAACGGRGDDDGPDEPSTFTPSAVFPPAGAELVVAVIGDFGDTSDLADGETDTFRVARLIESWDPALIATVGDNDYTDGQYAGSFVGLELGVGQYFHAYIGAYRGEHGAGAGDAADNRFFPIPGDHDYGDDCDNPRLGDYLDYFTLPVGERDETYYDVRRGDLHLFMLDTIVDCHQDDGAKLAAQRAWLQRAAAASDARFKVVLGHHPPYSSGKNHGSAEHMQWPFADWGIDLVIAGDDHVYERLDEDGVVYLVNGVGGVERHTFGAPIPQSRFRYRDDYGAVGLAVVPHAGGVALEVAFLDATGVRHDRFTLGDPAPTAPWYEPAADTTWQWQLSGAINTGYAVDLYDVDLVNTSDAVLSALKADGKRVVCYFSAGSYEDFRDDADAFPAAVLGDALDGWPDERWLDIRSPALRPIMEARLDLALARGCDGVEPDNVDGYQNESGFPLTASDQLAYNRFLATAAHARGLAIGLKNDLDQVLDLVADFDFAVNEQCHEYDECELLQPFVAAGKPVFVAEYASMWVDDPGARSALCASSRADGLRTLVLPLDLDDSFRFTCDP